MDGILGLKGENVFLFGIRYRSYEKKSMWGY